MRTFIALAILGCALAAAAPGADAEATDMTATLDTSMLAAEPTVQGMDLAEQTDATEETAAWRRRRRRRRRRYDRRRRFSDARRRRTFYDRRRRFSDNRRRRTFYARRRRTFYDRRRRRTFYARRRRTFYDRRRRRTYYCGPRRNGGWSNWNSWNTCYTSGGNKGYRWRYRSCNRPSPSCGGSSCSGSGWQKAYVLKHCLRHNWGGWSTCTATCGGGVQHRYRGVRQWPSCGGNSCPTGAQSRTCNSQACPIDCRVGNYGGYGACSKSCGGGTQRRSRSLIQPRYGGKGCPARYQYRSCGTSNCPVHCEMNPFGAWRPCTKSCGRGTQSRSRTVKRYNKHGGYTCPYKVGTRTCNSQACAVDGSVGPWRAWSTCTRSCGGGSMGRARSATPPRMGGKAHAHTAETRACNTHACPANCKTGAFTAWSTCTKSCGTGSQKRSRKQVEPKFGGKACPHYSETRNCNAQPCPVDCVTKKFGAYSTCTKSCGTGSQRRSRQQTEPRFGGKACPHYSETRPCNKHACPIDCVTNKFEAWSTCTKSCGTGSQKRRRTQVEPKFGGVACPHYEETRNCNVQACAVDCVTNTFAAWSTCTESCGTGSQQRKRTQVEPTFGGKACPHYEETRACNVHPCPIDGGWTAFSAWSACSKSCDSGNTFRTRSCTKPAPQFGGADCPEHGREDKPCNVHVCHCPTCSFVNGHVQIKHTTEHATGRSVHGPREVHDECAQRGPFAIEGWCAASFVVAHRCNYNRETKKCSCVCRKPQTKGAKRNEHELQYAERHKDSLQKVVWHHPGKPWTKAPIVVSKTGQNPHYGKKVVKKVKK